MYQSKIVFTAIFSVTLLNKKISVNQWCGGGAPARALSPGRRVRNAALPTGAPPIETHIHVLTTGFWPTYPPSPLNLPAALLTETNVFEEFYKAKYGGRKMQWQHSLGGAPWKGRAQVWILVKR